MPRVAYALPGVMSSAFLPVPAPDGRGFGPWDESTLVNGQPGTMGVPTGLPDFGRGGQQVNGVSVRGGGAGYAHGSGTMPGVWYPTKYWLSGLDGATLVTEGNTQTPCIYSDNQMPIPAADPRGRAAMLARPPVFLSGGDLRQPAGSRGPQWPSWLPSMSYGG